VIVIALSPELPWSPRPVHPPGRRAVRLPARRRPARRPDRPDSTSNDALGRTALGSTGDGDGSTLGVGSGLGSGLGEVLVGGGELGGGVGLDGAGLDGDGPLDLVVRLGDGLGRVVGLGDTDTDPVALTPGPVDAWLLAGSSDTLAEGVASSPTLTRPPEPPPCSRMMAMMVSTSTASNAISPGDRVRLGGRRRRGTSGTRS
jgi:hypothetical protein